MAYDGIITYAISEELADRITLGKIEKVYQPGPEELLIHIHTREGNVRLFVSASSQSARVCLTDNKYANPDQPPVFCMLLRKHIQGGRITAVRQHGSERIIEIDIEAQNELGFSVCKRLIIEIMGKHSNIVLTDIESGKVIDSVKRLSIDVNRYRQLLPGIIYKYPPEQEKLPFKAVDADTPLPHDAKAIMDRVAGISPAIAREMLTYCTEQHNASVVSTRPAARLREILGSIEDKTYRARIYSDPASMRGAHDTPREFHVADLGELSDLNVTFFESANECAEYFYFHREASNLVKQKSSPLLRTAQQSLSKALLKKKKLGEDLLRAENSDKYQLYGELITANIHLIKPGAKSAVVTNYYDGNPIEIPLDEKISASKNAQKYFRKYAKAKTAIHEKKTQLEENERDIAYLESVVQNIESAENEAQLDAIRLELQETGYVRRPAKAAQRKKTSKPDPMRYQLADGTLVLVGHNNTENDYLTMKLATKKDIWLHTKDIPGSHVIIRLEDGRSLDDLPADLIYEAASIAAYHSKARNSDNVPVDYVPVRYVKKPAGSKPGMVIFTHNQTVYVTPALPDEKEK